MVFAFIGTPEIIVIIVIALLLFGPQRLPEIARQIGSAKREMDKMRGEVNRALDFDTYLEPYDMPSYEAPAGGTTYAQGSYDSSGYQDYSYEEESQALQVALAVPPPGPTPGPTVTPRPVEENTAETLSANSSVTTGTAEDANYA